MEKSNFQMCKDFLEYDLKEKGIISNKEYKDIESKFNIKERTNIELQNLRDFVVMYFSKVVSKYDIVMERKEAMNLMDKMSAITGVIDNEKWNRGMPV